MVLTDYTTYDDIRAALGVGKTEITDATLSLELYANGLRLELMAVNPLLPSKYGELPSDADALSLDQTNFRLGARMFATYAVAKHLTTSLPLFSPKDIGDGKALMGRYSFDPYKLVISGVMARYHEFKGVLEAAYAVLFAAAEVAQVPPIGGFRAVSPSYDPVRGI